MDPLTTALIVGSMGVTAMWLLATVVVVAYYVHLHLTTTDDQEN